MTSQGTDVMPSRSIPANLVAVRFPGFARHGWRSGGAPISFLAAYDTLCIQRQADLVDVERASCVVDGDVCKGGLAVASRL